MTSPDRLVIATRGSKLALAQTGWVIAGLLRHHPDLRIDVMEITTRGDRDQRSFSAIGGKGLFTSEVEAAVADGRADVAVHSAKDLTADLAEGCTIVCVPARASVHDVVLGGRGTSGEERLGTLPEGATVGTSSMRRRSLLATFRPDLNVVEFRGNIDTRLRKIAEGRVDAAILAAAGLERLPGPDVDAAPLDPDGWVPAPAQGALALEARSDRPGIARLLAPLADAAARAEVMLERSFARTLEGGCSVPLGCLARAHGAQLTAVGYLGMPDGSHHMRDRISGPPAVADDLGRELATAVLDCGGSDILEDVRAMNAPEVPEP